MTCASSDRSHYPQPPALGCVYKLVEINGKPTIKLSQNVEKRTMPGKKIARRIYVCGEAVVDLLQRPQETPPEVGKYFICRHPVEHHTQEQVKPCKIEDLHKCYWSDGQVSANLPSLKEIRQHVKESLKTLPFYHKRSLNPTPYKVYVSEDLYDLNANLLKENQPIGRLE